MRQTQTHRQVLVGLLAAASLGLLAACGDDGADTSTNGPLLNGGGSGTGTLRLNCPTSVAAGVKVVNGFSATLLAGTAPVANTFIGISPTPNQGDVFAPAEASTATFGGNTDDQGRLTLGFTAPASATSGTVFQLVARSGSQTASCRVTVQTPSLVFTSPASSSVYNACTPVRLRVSSTLNGDPSTKVGGSVDLSADNGGVFTSNANSTACTGQATLTGVGISAATGDFQNPIYVLSPTTGTSTVTATDAATPGRTASVSVQFTDTATSVFLDADLLQVNASPSTSRFSNLTATVSNANGRAVANQPVRFTIESAVGGTNPDRINPPVRTTNASGVATARYEAGSNTGSATVSACVQDTGVCDRRTITVRPATTS